MQILNIAAYKFISIPKPEIWRDALKLRCDELGLKGTIVLANEGINLFLAADKSSIHAFLEFLRNDQMFGQHFCELDIKESFSDHQPFKRMVVRVAREIITMRHPTICPESMRAPSVDANTLKKWLDQGHDDNGREIVMLDARNAFEVEIGTFKNAIDLRIERFSQFPDALRNTIEKVPGGLKEKTIVSFCTGGIRCEKSVLFMKELDFTHVYQLDGGILRYFEEAGGTHFEGECFVFDERVALDTQLRQTTQTTRKT